MQTSPDKRLLYVFLFALFSVVIIFPCAAMAEETVLTPSIMLQSAYDDNVHFDGKGDIELRATPALKIEYGQEDWVLKGGGEAAIFRYGDLSEYDRENYKFWFGAERELNEKFQVNFDASFGYDHTFVDELTQSGTQTASALRRKYSLTPGIEWAFSEKDRLVVDLPYSEIKYAGKTNPDNRGIGGAVGWTHLLNNERTSVLARGSYNNYYYKRSDGDTVQDVFSLMGGMGYKPSEKIDLTGYLGLMYADSKVSLAAQSDKSSRHIYPSFDISGTYASELWKFTLGADRQVSPSTYGESSVRTRGRASGEYFFTERFSAYLEGAYYNTETGGLVKDSKTRTYYVRPWLKYRWSEDATIRLEFKHTNIMNQITNKDKQQNRIALRFEYHYPASL